MFNNKYQKILKIGKGFNGTVYKVLNKKENKFYALKNLNNIKDYEKEINIIKNIKSKYIIKITDNFFDEIEGYCIVMELCDGNLRRIQEKYKPKGLPLNIINKIFYQLNDALNAMNNINYTHRNLKPENILIKYTDKDKNNFDIKLTDFGLSTNEIFENDIYAPPEIKTLKFNNKYDLWSLGVILYELYTNKYIFDSNNPEEKENNRYKGKILNETNNEIINKLIKKLIQVDNKKRIKWEEYFNDIFFKIKENEQIIKIKIKVNINSFYNKIYYGNKDINENNIKLFMDNNQIKFIKEISNLKEGFYNFIILINQNIINCKDMFKDCINILEINFIKFDTKNVTNMSHMFDNCKSLKNLDITNFDTKNINDMSHMFSNCESLNKLDISKFDTKNAINMSHMFNNCKSLKNLDITNFNTKNVKDMSYMFSFCNSLNKLDASSFDTKNVINMSYMFKNCSSLNELDVSSFDTKNVINMSYMFYNCNSLKKLDVSNFNTKNVIKMDNIFGECSFKYDKKKFNLYVKKRQNKSFLDYLNEYF